MNVGQTVFSQLMYHLPSYEVQKGVERYRGDAHGRGFSCWDQYLAMAFAQVTYRESLRDIEACLRYAGTAPECRVAARWLARSASKPAQVCRPRLSHRGQEALSDLAS